MIKMNAAAAVYRRNSVLHEWPVLEVVGFSAVTAAVSYLVSRRKDFPKCHPSHIYSPG